MRAVIQRVTCAKVIVGENIVGEIGKGLLIFLGIAPKDTDEDIDYMIEKIINLRIFEDEHNKMNLSLLDTKGQLLIVSQFTLYGDCRKGRRPSFAGAAKPEIAERLYQKFLLRSKEIMGCDAVQEGIFAADMKVDIHNDGPVTLLLDSEKHF